MYRWLRFNYAHVLASDFKQGKDTEHNERHPNRSGMGCHMNRKGLRRETFGECARRELTRWVMVSGVGFLFVLGERERVCSLEGEWIRERMVLNRKECGE